MLTSLEVNSVISSTTVPTALSAQIVRICDMKRRAEVEMLDTGGDESDRLLYE